MDQPMTKARNLALDSGTGESYEQDEFMDGEESSSKEVKRTPFEMDSLTEQRFTPGASQNNKSSDNQRYPVRHNMNVEASIDESSSLVESGGRQNRPSAIETILNAGNKSGKGGSGVVMDDDDDDDDYEDDYDDDDF